MASTSTPSEAKMSREERIRRRAEELYKLRGNEPGSALDDWLLAESEIDLQERAIDQSLEQSFPASDPPVVSPLPTEAGTNPPRLSARSERRRSSTAQAT